MATISDKSWTKYIVRLRNLSNKAADDLIKFINNGHDIYNDPSMDKVVIDYAYGLATKYGEGAGALASEMYDALAELSGKTVPPAVPAPTAKYGEVAKAVYGTKLQSDKPEVMGGAVGRLVKMVGVDTMQQNALRDGAEWAWIPRGDTCAFCLTLASRGWQKASKKAIKNGHAEHIHANCDCTYAIRFSDDVDIEGYDPEALKTMYDEAEGATPNDKINYLRRKFYGENKDKIDAQAIPAAEKRIELNSPKAEETNVYYQSKAQDTLMDAYEQHRLSNDLEQTPAKDLGKDFFNVDYGNIDTKTAKAFSETVDDLSKQYDTSVNEIRVMTPSEINKNPGAFASTFHNYELDSSTILINPKKIDDIERLKYLTGKEGYMPKIPEENVSRYVATHEFAHTLIDTGTVLNDKRNWVGANYTKIQNVRKEINGIYGRYLKEIDTIEKAQKNAEMTFMMSDDAQEMADAINDSKRLQKQMNRTKISKYSMVNADEFMAEAFAHSQLGGGENPFVDEVMEVLNRNFRRKK